MALTVGVGTVMDAREIIIVISGAHKALALANCIEQGVNHMYTVSAIQTHRHGMIVCDDDATLELKVKTVKVRSLPTRLMAVFQEYRICSGTNLQIQDKYKNDHVDVEDDRIRNESHSLQIHNEMGK